MLSAPVLHPQVSEGPPAPGGEAPPGVDGGEAPVGVGTFEAGPEDPLGPLGPVLSKTII